MPFSIMAIVLFLAVDTVSDFQSMYKYIQVLYRYYTYNTPAGKGESRLKSRAMYCGHNTDDRVPSSSTSPPPLALLHCVRVRECYYLLQVYTRVLVTGIYTCDGWGGRVRSTYNIILYYIISLKETFFPPEKSGRRHFYCYTSRL